MRNYTFVDYLYFEDNFRKLDYIFYTYFKEINIVHSFCEHSNNGNYSLIDYKVEEIQSDLFGSFTFRVCVFKNFV